jgi:hypothetical protein
MQCRKNEIPIQAELSHFKLFQKPISMTIAAPEQQQTPTHLIGTSTILFNTSSGNPLPPQQGALSL